MLCYDLLVQQPLLYSRRPLHKPSSGTAANMWTCLIPLHVLPLMLYVFSHTPALEQISCLVQASNAPVDNQFQKYEYIPRGDTTTHMVGHPKTTFCSYCSLSNCGFGAAAMCIAT